LFEHFAQNLKTVANTIDLTVIEFHAINPPIFLFFLPEVQRSSEQAELHISIFQQSSKCCFQKNAMPKQTPQKSRNNGFGVDTTVPFSRRSQNS